MASPLIALRLPPDLISAIDAVRGEKSRQEWVRRAIELRLTPDMAVASREVPAPKPRPPVAQAAIDQRLSPVSQVIRDMVPLHPQLQGRDDDSG